MNMIVFIIINRSRVDKHAPGVLCNVKFDLAVCVSLLESAGHSLLELGLGLVHADNSGIETGADHCGDELKVTNERTIVVSQR